MKIRHILFLIAALVPTWASTQKPTRLEGQVTNGAPKAVLRYDPFMLDRPDSVAVPVANGRFTLELKLSKPLQAILELGEQRLPVYFEPGDAQVLTQDANGRATMSGTGSNHSAFLQSFLSANIAYFDTATMHDRLLTEAIDPLELDLFEARRSQEKLYKDMLAKENLSAAFRQMLEADVKYNYDRWLLAYPVRRANAKKADTEVRNLPGSFEEGFDIKMLNNPEALSSRVYREYVWYYVSYFSAKENNYQKWKDHNAALNAKCMFAETRLSGPVLTWFQAYCLAQYCERAAPGSVEHWMGALQKGEGGAEYAKPIQAMINKSNAEMAAAKAQAKNNPTSGQAPDEMHKFKMVGLDGKERFLSEFKGKVVYIDFWASWCGPCRNQFPHSKVLKEKVHATLSKKQQKEIVFLYISIDDDEAAWRKAITDLGIEGEHAHSGARWQNGAGAYFNVSGIPRYMILDKSGKIVNYDAPRPSSEEIYQKLTELL